MPSVYARLGPYDIKQEIGRGGMASVFLAVDTRTNRPVALRSVLSRQGEDILDAERRGAELQRQFCQSSSFVPEVYDHGTEGGYFYVAMEYVDGENLADLIRRGPLPADRAVTIAIELCRFLEDARRFAWKEGDRDFQHLLHGDLTPVNVRVTTDGRVKVLDFGIAKALSMSRKVTRNDFGNLSYLSPERIESGGEMDATDGFWAVGVMLHEMLHGLRPFVAPDTRRLERLIVARRPAPLPDGVGPVGLRAVVAKLLGPTPADRYVSADAIRQDLERVQSGADTEAQKEGWPGKAADEQATRRMSVPPLPEEVTRRTGPPPLPVATARTAGVVTTPTPKPGGVPAAVPPAGPGPRAVLPPPLPQLSPRPAAVHPVRGASILTTALNPRAAQLALAMLGAFVALVMLNEIWVGRTAGRIANTVPSQELATIGARWNDYERLSGRSLGPATWRLRRMLVQRTTALTDRLNASYRDGLAVVWSAQWTAARDVLRQAVAADPGSGVLNASLRYSEGHLHRISGDELKDDQKPDAARREFAAAVTAFREAAQLRSNWPDPFVGLSRTFVTGLADVDRGADALAQARRLGYTPSERDTKQLADGYADRGAALWRSARDLRQVPQERDFLNRAAAAYRQALDLYGGIASFSGVPASIRRAQAGLDRVRERVAELDGAAAVPSDQAPLGFAPLPDGSGDIVR